jgi:hypothetical protein
MFSIELHHFSNHMFTARNPPTSDNTSLATPPANPDSAPQPRHWIQGDVHSAEVDVPPSPSRSNDRTGREEDARRIRQELMPIQVQRCCAAV